MASYEIEIKSLLGSKDKADDLMVKLQKDSSFKSLGAHKQLNHYFVGGDLKNLFEKAGKHLSDAQKMEFNHIVHNAKDFSVRTRLADDELLLVVKATVDDTTSANGTARQEFEAKLNELDLDELDNLILDAGFTYQAKWSRERQDFKYKDLSVSIDKNAGYGYLAEFESVIEDQSKADETKSVIRDRMKELGVEELAQDRLERMFDYYNKNWKDYYGTEKTFIID